MFALRFDAQGLSQLRPSFRTGGAARDRLGLREFATKRNLPLSCTAAREANPEEVVRKNSSPGTVALRRCAAQPGSGRGGRP